MSSLTKHLRPDGLKGYQRRARLTEAIRTEKKPVSDQTRGHVPVRFRLGAIQSDVAVASNRRPQRPRKDDTKLRYDWKLKGKGGGKPMSGKDTRTSGSLRKGEEGVFVNSPTGEHLHALPSFTELPLRPSLMEATHEAIRHALPHGSPHDDASIAPTPIQAASLPVLLAPASSGSGRRHYVLAAETGSGKTLAYLLPVMEALKREEDVNSDVRKVERPRAVILAPAAELVAQVSVVAKSLARGAKLRILPLTQGLEKKKILRSLAEPIDIIIGTPRGVCGLLEDGLISASELRWLVMDEADTLFDKDFTKDIENTLETMGKVASSTGRGYSAMAVSATLPKAVSATLERLLPGATRIATPHLHTTGPRLRQNFVDLKEWQNNRERALLEALKSSTDTTTLVFCNRRTTAQTLAATLHARGLTVGLLHGRCEPAERMPILSALGVGSLDTLRPRQDRRDKAAKEEDIVVPSTNGIPPRVVISTDYASRGLDTSRVGHVILYDFPTTMVDYLHRIGRTGRAGRRGRVTCLIGKRDRQLSERIWRAVKDQTVLS